MAGPVAGNSRDGAIPAGSAAAGPAPARAPIGARVQASHRLRYSLPWVAILFITSAFHFYRGVPVDGWIFLAAGLVVGFDVARRHRQGHLAALHRAATRREASNGGPSSRARRREQPWLRNAALAGVAALCLVVAVVAPVDSAGIPAVVGLVGAVMLLLAWPEPAPAPAADSSPAAARAPRPMRRAAWWWGAVLLFLCLWELGNYFADQLAPEDAGAFPPLTDLLQPLFDNDASRWIMLIVWLAACAGLLRVVRRP